MSEIPYLDQIWNSVEGHKHEDQVLSAIRKFKNSEQFHICLVDLVTPNSNTKKVITDNIVDNINFSCFSLAPEFWGVYSYSASYQNTIPTKLFNCFINRTDPFRQSWFYQLVRQELINKGNVSFNLEYRDYDYKHSIDNSSSVEAKQELYDWIFAKGLDIFISEHTLMRDKVPFRNFTGDLDQAIVDSKIGIVIETYFDNDERQAIALSEKTFRQLQLPRPFVLFGNPRAVSVLRDAGFDVYDDYVDHSYDSFDNVIQKQIELLKIVAEFENIQYNAEMLLDFEQRAKHNSRLLEEFKQRLPTKLEELKEYMEKQ